VVDFGIERHTLVTGRSHNRSSIDLINSYTGCNNKSTLIQGEGATSEEV
jgi:hypothetical protein